MMPSTIIILGAGPSGIAMAHYLKAVLKYDDFVVFEKLNGAGGTWLSNTYPGCGCDIPSHLYSFSFNLNPHWSQALCDQPEILKYMNDTIDKFNLRNHLVFDTECLSATWADCDKRWHLLLRKSKTGESMRASSRILISAVGALSIPKEADFPGMETFKGPIFHTAEWNHSYDYKGKRMAVIGNGCSAAQVVPNVADDVKSLNQFARSAQWYHERPNKLYDENEKWRFKNLPLALRYLRYSMFSANESMVKVYGSGKSAESERLVIEDTASQYIRSAAPKKYHDILIPKFPVGCKRRIFDPGYLAALHKDNVQLIPEAVTEFYDSGVVTSSGQKHDVDVVVLATGFRVTDFLVPMVIIGKHGGTLDQQWRETGGSQAYYGSFVHNFPNFGLVFGPNTFPAHGSALFSIETSAAFLAKSMILPIITNRVTTVEVKEDAEEKFARGIQSRLNGSVHEAGCSNWFLNENQKNVTLWPELSVEFWKQTFFPKSADFVLENYSGSQSSDNVFGFLQKHYRDVLGGMAVAGALIAWKRLGRLGSS